LKNAWSNDWPPQGKANSQLTLVAGGESVSRARQSDKAALHNSAEGLQGPDHTTRPSDARATNKKHCFLSAAQTRALPALRPAKSISAKLMHRVTLTGLAIARIRQVGR
jgi:hypothetical protein